MSSSALVASSDSTSASPAVITTAFFPGQRFQIQRYQTHVGEYMKEANDRHFIVHMRESAWAERRGANGSWVKFLLQRGSLNIVPSGPVPEVRMLTSTNMIICALEKSFTREIALETDRQPPNRTAFHVCDTPIEGLVGLMINDFEASRPCALYSETLAHALAMRFLFYGSSSERTPNSSVEPLPPRILSRIRDRIEAELDTGLSLGSPRKRAATAESTSCACFVQPLG
jgi:AraC family transcriptional regulator